MVYHTWDNQLTIDQNFPFRTYWRVSAQGLFRHPLGSYSNQLNLADVLGYSEEDIQQSGQAPPQLSQLTPLLPTCLLSLGLWCREQCSTKLNSFSPTGESQWHSSIPLQGFLFSRRVYQRLQRRSNQLFR